VQSIQGAYLQLLEGGITNGRGNTQVHASISQLYQWWLAQQCSQVINQSIVPDIMIPAYGYNSGFPTVWLGGIDDEFIGKALDRFKKGQDLGIKLSESQVREVGGFEQPADESDALTPPQPGQQPGGNQDPFGGLFGNDGGSGPPKPVPTWAGDSGKGATGNAVDTFRGRDDLAELCSDVVPGVVA